MSVGSPLFFIASLIAFAICMRRNSPLAKGALLAFNLIFVALFFDSLTTIVPLAAFCLAGYGAVNIASRWRGLSVFWALLTVLLLLFIVIKKYAIAEQYVPLGLDYPTIGLSYILFRVLHLIIDCREGTIEKPPTIREFFTYILFFLTFVSGPINRFDAFREDLDEKPAPLDKTEIAEALQRIVIGVLKVFVVSVCAFQISLNLPLTIGVDPTGIGAHTLVHPAILDWFSIQGGDPALRLSVRYLLRCFAFLAYMYFNFSGYMDIVIGIGRILGFRIPENFNHPFGAGNFLEFWSRWHITLSDWFRTYLFNPLLKTLASATSSRSAAPYLAVPAFFVTFFVMGIWHGTTAAFVIYGVMLASGVSANMFFQILAQRGLGRKKYRKLCGNFVYRNLCRSSMIAFFALSLTCLWFDADEIAQMAILFGVLGLIKLWITASIAVFVAVLIWDLAESVLMDRHLLLTEIFFGAGMIFLIAVWGDVGGFQSMLRQAVGLALPGAFIAVIGAAVIVLSGRLRTSDGIAPENLNANLYRLSFHVFLFFVAMLMQTGSVPEFVYEGF